MRTNNYFLGGDPTIDSNFNLGQNMTKPPAEDDIYYEMYAGKNDSSKVRSLVKVFGYNQSKIVVREKYFDGKTMNTNFRTPWTKYVDLEGTDAMSFHPGLKKEENLTVFLDDLLRNGKFHYYDTKVYNGLTTYRYLLDNDTIYSKKYNPGNGVYYSDQYNGFSNMSTIIKAPFYAHKPYYYQCNDTPADMLPEIKMLNWTKNTTGDKDDQILFNESFFDIEPFSGGTVRAVQKLMISALIEKDEVWEMDSKFVPIYFVFRTGNFTDENINDIFGDLVTGLGIKSITNVLFVTLITLFIALASFIHLRGNLQKVGDTTDNSEKSNLIV
jgi:hypothetical protein